MAGLNMNYREFSKVLKKNGWKLERYSGDHAIWKKNGELDITVPIHPNPIYLQRFVKEHKLIV